MGIGLLGLVTGLVGHYIIPSLWLGTLSGAVGASWVFFGLFRAYILTTSFRQNSAMKARLLVLLIALYGGVIWVLLRFIHPWFQDLLLARIVLQFMLFLSVALNAVLIANPDASQQAERAS